MLIPDGFILKRRNQLQYAGSTDYCVCVLEYMLMMRSLPVTRTSHRGHARGSSNPDVSARCACLTGRSSRDSRLACVPPFPALGRLAVVSEGAGDGGWVARGSRALGTLGQQWPHREAARQRRDGGSTVALCIERRAHRVVAPVVHTGALADPMLAREA